ncbi:hypothetical protein [Micromonospora sp. NPDC048063]|uniref:hypothetical protein n=1 Tax=Micromonospora sp. NPDC048063 TaxID=3364256 RepID=UPI0037133F2E
MQTETMAVAPTIEGEATETAMPAPDLSVLTEQQPPVEQGKDDKVKPQELAETSPASVGLVVALVVVSIVAAVVVAMWMVSPLMALLLGAGLIVVAVLAGAGWLAWRKYTRRSKDRSGRDGAGRGDRPGKSPNGRGKGDSWWPFGRSKTPGGGGKTPGGGGRTPGGKAPKGGGKTPSSGGKPAGAKSGSLWPFGRDKTPGGKTPGAGKTPKTPKGGTTPGSGGKPAGTKTGRWPFSRSKTPGGGGKTPGGGGKTPGGGGKPPASAKTSGGGTKPASDSGGKKPSDVGRKAKTAGGAALLGLLGLARPKAKSKDDKTSETGGQKPGKDDSAKSSQSRPAPGGHRPETVIDVDLDDITVPGGRSSSSSSGPSASAHRTAPRTAAPPFDPGPPAGSEWMDRPAPMPLHSTAHHQTPVINHLGGPEMSTTTSGDIDQDAMRVANRYAGLIEKAQTLQERGRACRDAADQYRRDARANQESAENHKMAARTIRDANVAHEHAVAARDAEAEAAREILAARYYEEQAEEYEAQARAIGF